ncbi:replication initiator protein A [Marinilactibacillus kalidii]|uniref:replication initiator protein A n=1 Tax=Marinilactibacillus kalidii TaxID=2820274 RepID=UPI001ABE57AC|nr:replication initiator protein A [Marinilactibacillus kalidii]
MSNRVNITDEYREKFYRLPKVFFTNDVYKKLSNNAKLAWAILRDRVDLSQKNNWVDDKGDIYFIFTNKELMGILNIASTSTLNTVKKELLNSKLLEQEKRGLNKANRLYLLNPDVTMDDIYEIKHQENNLISELEEKEFENTNFEKKDSQSADKSGHSKIEQPVSENRNSIFERLDVRKSNSNDTDFIKTKDIKDIKDNKNNISQADLNSILRKNNKENDSILITEYINQQSLEKKYGTNFLNVLKNYSKGEFDLFNQFIKTIDYAVKSAETDTNSSIEIGLLEDLYYSNDLRQDLTQTLYNVLLKIRTDKYQKIKDPKAYLFISIKQTIIHWITQIKASEI